MIPKVKHHKVREITKFATLCFEMNLNLKRISRDTNISYPVLLDLKTGKRTIFKKSTITLLSTYLNIPESDIL